MAAPFTQAYIQTQIDFYAAEMQTATQSQEYSYDEGPAGQFGLKKGKLEDIQKALDKWLDYMEKYYPDAFATQPQVYFNEIAFKNG